MMASGASGSGAGEAAAPRRIGRKDLIAMERTASSLSGVTENLAQQIKTLDAEIRADEASKFELGRLIAQLEMRRDDLRAQMSTNAGWSATYDKEIGPFAAKYEQMTGEIEVLYSNAKAGHAKGIALLEREFGYHPAFKRPQDTFTATAFRPK